MENYNYYEILKDFVKVIYDLGQDNELEKLNINNIKFNDKEYIICKGTDYFLLKSSDGRSLEFKIDIREMKYGQTNKCYYDIKIVMDLLNRGVLLINKTIPCNNDKKVDNLSCKIFEDCSIIYISDEYDYHYLIWNAKENQFNYEHGMTHGDNEYIYFDGKDKYRLSSDLSEITGIFNKPLPKKEEIYSFNKEEEKQKLIHILNNTQLNEITRNSLLEVINSLENKEELVNRIKRAYQETVIPKCREILKQELELNKVMVNSIFTQEEITFILSYIQNKFINNKMGYTK